MVLKLCINLACFIHNGVNFSAFTAEFKFFIIYFIIISITHSIAVIRILLTYCYENNVVVTWMLAGNNSTLYMYFSYVYEVVECVLLRVLYVSILFASCNLCFSSLSCANHNNIRYYMVFSCVRVHHVWLKLYSICG